MRVVGALVLVLILAPFAAASPTSGWGYSSSDVLADGVLDGVQSTGYNGTGVIIAVADTGIDLDHACFRNSTDSVGTPGPSHRKIVYLDDTIDGWDTQGHQQFRHGTHVAGILACSHVNGNESMMNSFSSGSSLVVQDIVNQTGWHPPDVEVLLSQASDNGAIINSWSWGDDSVEYTNRSSDVDSWLMENPWSLVFVAPGNNGNQMMEPANARNVVAVAASNSDENATLWPSNSHGPDADGRRGIFIAAPGQNIVSAGADGLVDSMNNESRSMTGTSMAAPMAASFTAVLQEMVESETGFAPSGAQLRSLLALSADPITGNAPDEFQGYGRPNFSRAEGAWMHDSFAMEGWSDFISQRGSTTEELLASPWNGSGAAGPFLSEGDSAVYRVVPKPGSDFVATMSYNAKPQPYGIDDLRLIIHTSNGMFAVDDEVRTSGTSALYYSSVASPLGMNSSNETTVMIRLSAAQLEGVEWLDIEIIAANITQGNSPGTVGLEGDSLGFALSVTGLDSDDDGDGVYNHADLCINTLLIAPVDSNGCAIQNNAPELQFIIDPSGGNHTNELVIMIGVSDEEGDVVNIAMRLFSPNLTIDLGDCARRLENVTMHQCIVVVEEDLVIYQINRHDWRLEIVAIDENNSEWTSPFVSNLSSNEFTIWWENPALIGDGGGANVSDGGGHDDVSQNRALLWGIFGIVTGAIVAAGFMFRGFEKKYIGEVPPPFIEEE